MTPVLKLYAFMQLGIPCYEIIAHLGDTRSIFVPHEKRGTECPAS